MALLLLASCGQNERHHEAIAEYAEVAYDGYDYEESVTIPAYDSYRISLEVNPELRTVEGISHIAFTNRTGKLLDTVVFKVYLGGIDGEFNLLYASLDSEALAYDFEGTVLTIHLPEPLLPDVTIELLLQYDATIPMSTNRTGGNEEAMWFGMFLPVLATHQNDSWHVEEFHPIGSPFLIDTANYQVAITTPLRYMVVGTGFRSEEIIEDTDTRITRFTAHTTRDFAFAVSAYFNHAHISTESGIEIHLYYYTEALEIDHILEHARQSMEYLEYHVGSFPFGHMTIVEADAQRDIAVFSQMILMNSLHLQFGDLWALSHGLTEQWFAHIVGTNRIDEPWLANGLTRFVHAGIFYDEETLTDYMERVYASIAHRDDLKLTNGLRTFEYFTDYEQTHGRMAMLMMYDLYRLMGADVFWQFINQYYHEFSFNFATAEDFKRLAETHHGESLQWFFDEWMV